MLINCDKKTINLLNKPIKNTYTTWVEQDILVPDSKPDVMKITHVNIKPYINNYEVQGNNLKIEGKINYFVIYTTTNDLLPTRGMYISYPFSVLMPCKDLEKEMNLMIKVMPKNIIYSLPNERKIAIKSELLFSVECKESIKLDIVQSFPDEYNIESKTSNCKCMNYLDNKSSIIASKEDVMIKDSADDFYEMLDVNSEIKNIEYKESYNKIMVKGDICAEVLYLVDSTKSQIKKVDMEVPFSGMIEFDNINDKSKFILDLNIKDLNIIPNADIVNSKTMSIDYQIEVFASMYEDDEITYIEDFYSQNHDIKTDAKIITPIANHNTVNKMVEVKESLNNILDGNYKIIDYKINLNNLILKNENINVIVEGNAKLELLLQDIETLELSSKNIDLMINELVTLENLEKDVILDINNSLDKILVTNSGRDIEVKLRMNISINCKKILSINYAENIDILDTVENNLESMYMYMIKPTDDLWSIAKKYKTSVNKIMKTNTINEENNIYENQKILIIR